MNNIAKALGASKTMNMAELATAYLVAVGEIKRLERIIALPVPCHTKACQHIGRLRMSLGYVQREIDAGYFTPKIQWALEIKEALEAGI